MDGVVVDHLALHQWVRGSIPAVGCMWFPNPCSLSQVFSGLSGFLLPSKLVRCIVCYVDVCTPLEISLTTLRVILGVGLCLNIVIIIITRTSVMKNPPTPWDEKSYTYS